MSFTYKGLQITYSKHTVTEEEVDRQIERLLQQNPRVALITERPTQNGDEIVLDYSGSVDSVVFPGGTGENQTLVLGSGMFIPGFEEQLIDKMPGESVNVFVTFPKEYHAPELAGKDAVFACKIHAIRVKTPYEADDVFAKEVGGCDTFPEMKEKLWESLQSYTDQRGEMDLQDRLLQQAAQSLEYECTQEQLDEAVDQQMKALEAQLVRQNLTLEMYCSFMNTTVSELQKDAVPTARAALQTQAAVEKIAQLENLQATEEDIAKAIALVARQNNMTVEQLKPYYTEELRQAVIKNVLSGKVMSLIREHAVITQE